jgi:hypothetical protein
MTPAETQLTIVIPTWNRCDLITTCLNSLRQQTFRAFHVIVVDDASEDDTVNTLREAYPEVAVLARDKRGGFARATNTGLKRAETPWVMCLNNDITLAEDALERLMRVALNDDASLLTPLMVWQDDPHIVYAAGDLIRENGRPESYGFRIPRVDFRPPDSIFGVTFGAAVMSREALDNVGLLDVTFGAYFEDADWCCRARLKGYTARCVHDAVVYHVGSASIQKDLWWRSRQCWQNHALLVIKNFPARVIVTSLWPILRERVHQTARMWSALRAARGSFWALRVYIKAQAALWKKVPGALRARRAIQRARRLTPAQFNALLGGNSGDD